jgi:ribosome maturation factor RimP
LRAAFFVLAHDHIDDDQGEDAAEARPEDMPMQAGLEARIIGIIHPTVSALGYELVRVMVLGRERPTVQIMADRADGAQIAVEDCEKISRAVSAVMDVDDPIPGRWTLEVSSAGIDRPLTRVKDWVRFVGHLARVELSMPVGGRRRINGIIMGADAEFARVREADVDYNIPITDIRRAKLILTDALIEASAPSEPPLAN